MEPIFNICRFTFQPENFQELSVGALKGNSKSYYMSANPETNPKELVKALIRDHATKVDTNEPLSNEEVDSLQDSDIEQFAQQFIANNRYIVNSYKKEKTESIQPQKDQTWTDYLATELRKSFERESQNLEKFVSFASADTLQEVMSLGMKSHQLENTRLEPPFIPEPPLEATNHRLDQLIDLMNLQVNVSNRLLADAQKTNLESSKKNREALRIAIFTLLITCIAVVISGFQTYDSISSQDKLSQGEAALVESLEKLSKLQTSSLDQQRARLELADKKAANQDAALKQQGHELEKLRNEFSTTNKELVSTQEEITTLSKKVKELSTKLDSSSGGHASTKAQ